MSDLKAALDVVEYNVGRAYYNAFAIAHGSFRDMHDCLAWERLPEEDRARWIAAAIEFLAYMRGMETS